MTTVSSSLIAERVAVAVDSWLRWLPTWHPGTARGRVRVCRKCTGSPLVAAVGLDSGVPHQVVHGLVSRLHRVIDKLVDEFTAAELPALYAELHQQEAWNSGGYDPGAGVPPEYEGLDLDPEPEPGEQPPLFTLAGLAEESKAAAPTLPQPPLSKAERQQLMAEIGRADDYAQRVGNEVCFALLAHRDRVVAAVARFVEPQIADLLAELSKHLEPPA